MTPGCVNKWISDICLFLSSFLSVGLPCPIQCDLFCFIFLLGFMFYLTIKKISNLLHTTTSKLNTVDNQVLFFILSKTL